MFTEQKASDLSQQLERNNQRNEDRAKLEREELQRDHKEKLQRLQSEKDHAEARYEAKRKAFKDLENRLAKESSNAEREKAVLLLKYQNLETQQAQLIQNQETELMKLRETNEHLQNALESGKAGIAQELENARRQCIEMERQLTDQINNYDKDKALWEGRFNFLEQQRDQSKKDLEETQQKFNSLLDKYRQDQNDNKKKSETAHQQILEQTEAKYLQRMKEERDNMQHTLNEANQKIKSMEREKAHLSERLELTSRD